MNLRASSLQEQASRLWYERAPAWWLRPLALVYAGLAGARRYAYRHGWREAVRLSRPVIVVGNLSVGGTGKTPLVCWLAARLAQSGFQPGVVTRGYGGSHPGPRRVTRDDTAELVGDEALVLSRRAGVPVAVGRDRPAAAQLLIDAGCDVILSDDGLQHYRLQRDCEIVVIDAQRGFGNGSLLPAGPLREPPSRLQEVDAVVLNGSGAARLPSGLPDAPYHMQLLGDEALALHGASRRPLREFSGEPVHAVAGIGNPERFFAMLRSYGIRVMPHALADHAALTLQDVSFEDGHEVLMTEKDAVKCAAFARSGQWYVPVSASFEADESAQLLQLVERAVRAADARAGGAQCDMRR